MQWIHRNIPAQTWLIWLSVVLMVAAILLAVLWWPRKRHEPEAVKAVRARPRRMDEPPTDDEPVRVVAVVVPPVPAKVKITRALPAAAPAKVKVKPAVDPWEGATEGWSPIAEQKLCAAELPPVELLGGAEQMIVVHEALAGIEDGMALFRTNMDAILDSLCRDQPEMRLRVCTSGETTGQWDMRELRAELAAAGR